MRVEPEPIQREPEPSKPEPEDNQRQPSFVLTDIVPKLRAPKLRADKLAGESIDPNHAYGLALQNQTLYGNPRMIRFGLRLGF